MEMINSIYSAKESKQNIKIVMTDNNRCEFTSLKRLHTCVSNIYSSDDYDL